jgi:hypothetical protein
MYRVVYKVELVSKQKSNLIIQLHLTVQNDDDDDDVCCVCEEEQLIEEQILYHAK